jgi:hypothetical protein
MRTRLKVVQTRWSAGLLMAAVFVGACGDQEDCERYAAEAEQIRAEVIAQWEMDEADSGTVDGPCVALINDWYHERCEAYDAARENQVKCENDGALCPVATEGCPCRLGGVCGSGLWCVSDACITSDFRGASHLEVVTDGCSLPPDAAFTIPEGGQPTTQTGQGPRVENGVDGALVSCQVHAQGDGYSISGSIQVGGLSFTVHGSVNTTDNGHVGSGTISQTDTGSSTALSSDLDGCELMVLPTQEIAPGRAWGSFTCASVASGPVSQCAAAGSFMLENCVH